MYETNSALLKPKHCCGVLKGGGHLITCTCMYKTNSALLKPEHCCGVLKGVGHVTTCFTLLVCTKNPTLLKPDHRCGVFQGVCYQKPCVSCSYKKSQLCSNPITAAKYSMASAPWTHTIMCACLYNWFQHLSLHCLSRIQLCSNQVNAAPDFLPSGFDMSMCITGHVVVQRIKQYKAHRALWGGLSDFWPHTCTHTHIHTHAQYTCTHTHMHTHTHTRKRKQQKYKI